MVISLTKSKEHSFLSSIGNNTGMKPVLLRKIVAKRCSTQDEIGTYGLYSLS